MGNRKRERIRKEQSMQQKTDELSLVELGTLIGEYRREKGIGEVELYQGICTRAKGRRLEQGQNAIDEWQLQLILSRLHIQPYLCDCALSKQQFLIRERRMQLERSLFLKRPEEARAELEQYRQEILAESSNPSQQQYILWKEAQIAELTCKARSEEPQNDVGELFRAALNISMSTEFLERQLTRSSLIAQEEIEMYLGYRFYSREMSYAEYKAILSFFEKYILSADFFSEVYAEAGERCVRLLMGQGDWEEAELVCRRVLEVLKEYSIGSRQSELYLLLAEIRRSQQLPAEEAEQECRDCHRMAYYVALALGDEEQAALAKEQLEEEK